MNLLMRMLLSLRKKKSILDKANTNHGGGPVDGVIFGTHTFRIDNLLYTHTWTQSIVRRYLHCTLSGLVQRYSSTVRPDPQECPDSTPRPPPSVPHKRGDDTPNLGVLIPVITILTVLAIGFFGWLGLPWPKMMAWWKRKRTRPAESDANPKDQQQQQQRSPPAGREPGPQLEPAPGSALSYAKAFERSHVDALKLDNLGGRPKNKPKTKTETEIKGESKTKTADHAAGDETPDLASGQMTPGQQSTLSAVPERRASPWDPTRTRG